jgi:hypothetical protein
MERRLRKSIKYDMWGVIWTKLKQLKWNILQEILEM